MRELVGAHGEVLSGISAQGESDVSLKDLADSGIADEDIATSVVIKLVTQLKSQSEIPVMIAIDGYNLLFEEPDFFFRLKAVTADQLNLVRAFRGLTMCGSDVLPEFEFPTRGVVVAVESNKYQRCIKKDYYTNAGKMLWKQGFSPLLIG